VQPSWSARNIHIPFTAGSHELDLRRPFLSADFSRNSSPPVNRQAQVREDLLELGILLLEIWHENNLETQFAQQLSTSHVSFMTRACAHQWVDDLQNPLPDLYYRAASHCVSDLVTPDPRASEWDHPDLWKSDIDTHLHPSWQQLESSQKQLFIQYFTQVLEPKVPQNRPFHHTKIANFLKAAKPISPQCTCESYRTHEKC
jgi:hypothetical protein